MAKERSEVAEKDKWNVELLYPSLNAWEKEFAPLAGSKAEGGRFPNLLSFKGKLGESPEKLANLLKLYFHIERALSKLYTYAHLRHDEDVVHEQYKNAYDRISLLFFDFGNEASWIHPEILQLDEKKFQSYLETPELKDYRIFLEKLHSLKPYTLSADKEEILALSEKALEAPQKAFRIFSDAELKFPKVEDSKGEKRDLSSGSYSFYMQSKDRTLRQNTFKQLQQGYQKFENTVSELINGQVQKHVFNAKVRGYPSSLHAALTPHQIDTKVYHNLVDTVRESLPHLHRYMKVRKKLLGFESLHFYDLHVSLVSEFDKEFSFEEAKKLILQSVAVLGKEYQKALERGFCEERWVDVYENARKRSGAYSSGCFDSSPYILMNYHSTLRDVMTLSHEAGHSMHTYFSNKGQPYQYSRYPIFLAEVASTFHEDLLFRHLLLQAKTSRERCYLLNQKIEDIRATLFRQTQFAEFELKLHTLAEEGTPLSAPILKEAYLELNRDYYGPEVTIDPEIAVEFLRIPHFYYNFYVYQYATGIAAAAALSDRVLAQGEKARDAYLKFLSSGSSKYPLELLKMAGVDMSVKDPILKLLDRFDALVTELEIEMK